MADEQEVIDWDEAMEQCGGDEEFLHELLGDLKEELETQIKKIEAAMEPKVLLLNIRSAAHVVKGAAANLMCEELRLAAYDLEMVAKNAPPDEPVTEALERDLQTHFAKFKKAGDRFQKYVEELDI